MAVAAGYYSLIGWNDSASVSYILNAYNWTMSYEVGEGETTDFTSVGPKTFIALTTEWSGSLTLRFEQGSAYPDLDNTLTNIKLFIYYSAPTEFGFGGTAFCTAENPTVDVNGVPEMVVNFRGSAALTIGDISGISLA